VDAGYAKAGGGELVGLIVHKGDERGDDEAGASPSDGRELVAEALAGAGWHDEQDVLAVSRSTADRFLIGAEGGETEGAVEQGGERGHALLVSHNVCLLVNVAVWEGRVNFGS
jgi:hypothetical protein